MTATRRRGPDKLGGSRERGRSPHVALRMPEELVRAIRAWADARSLTLPEAIRRLISLGLEANE